MSFEFNEYLKRIKNRKRLLEKHFPLADVFSHADPFSDLMFSFYWEWLYDAMLKADDEKERNELGKLAGDFYKRVTERRTIEKTGPQDKKSTLRDSIDLPLPVPSDTFKEIERKIQLM